MKNLHLFLYVFITVHIANAQELNGAWEKVDEKLEEQKTIKLFSDAYFTTSTYLESSGEFVSANGGTYTINESDYIENYEVNSQSTAVSGSFINFDFKIENDTLHLKDKNSKNEEVWVKIDEANDEMVSCWRIHEVFRDSKWVKIDDKPRKTLKMLTDNYYQVLALNSQTGEFFGSSGGKWQYEDGKHQEMILFFSKNPKMTGDTLTFKMEVEDGIWKHNGKSSKGEYIQERWKRYK